MRKLVVGLVAVVAATVTLVPTASANWTPPPPGPPEWCSPGFWKNNHGAWALTVYTPQSIDWKTGQTLETILSNPRTYARTGDYERIADELSWKHPGVNWTGERVPDSCPLAADEAAGRTTPS
jgi:hypothetical protein